MLTKYQKQIIEDIKNGALLQCTEGINYKVWLKYPDNTERKIRRDSACKVCDKYKEKLIFGESKGIRWNKNYK